MCDFPDTIGHLIMFVCFKLWIPDQAVVFFGEKYTVPYFQIGMTARHGHRLQRTAVGKRIAVNNSQVPGRIDCLKVPATGKRLQAKVRQPFRKTNCRQSRATQKSTVCNFRQTIWQVNMLTTSTIGKSPSTDTFKSFGKDRLAQAVTAHERRAGYLLYAGRDPDLFNGGKPKCAVSD